LNDIYTKSIKDLCDQATCVDVALANNVELTQDCLQQLENKLLRVRQLYEDNKRQYIKILYKTPKMTFLFLVLA